jgi:hypothetical protein
MVSQSLTSTLTERGALKLPDFNKFGTGVVELVRLSVTDMKSFIQATAPEMMNGLDRRNVSVKFLAAFKPFTIPGECLVWSVAEQALYGVDIECCRIHRFDWASQAKQSWHTPERVCCMAYGKLGPMGCMNTEIARRNASRVNGLAR